MKKWLSALLLVILLIQALPVDALAATGRVLTDEELDRAYALTGLAKGDGLYHNGMTPNDSMSGMQLAHWLEDRLDTQLHNIDDVLARARYQLDELKEKYPIIYKAFTESPFYSQVQAMTLQAEELRQDMNYQLERIKTDVNMIAEMRSRMQDGDNALFDSDRVRASARVLAAEAELKEIRKYITQNAAGWDSTLQTWLTSLQSDSESGSESAITASLRDFMKALWKKFNLGEGSDEDIEAELRKLLKEEFLEYLPGSESADAFVEDAVTLMRDLMQQSDPDGETASGIIREIQSLVKRLYEKYGQDGVDDEALLADLEALMREIWQKYGPGSEINQAFTAAWTQLLKKYGVDGEMLGKFIAEMNAMLEDMWNKYGPDGEEKGELLAKIKEIWGMYGDMGEGEASPTGCRRCSYPNHSRCPTARR